MTRLQEERVADPGDRPSAGADSPAATPAADDRVLVSEVADLAAVYGHRFGRREVRVSKARVTVIDDAGIEILCVPMADIKTARTEPLVGGARLELTTKEGVVPVAEFTASVAARFSEMARGIEQLARGEALSIKWDFQKARCDRCGRLLPEKDGRCPACIKRMAVLARVLSYMGPYRGRAALVILMAVCSTGASVAVPQLTKLIADNVLHGHGSLAEKFARLLFYVG